MIETFGEAADQLGGFATRLLGWRPDEFWHSTPAELAAVLREPREHSPASALSRDQIAQMMERDTHG